MWRILCQFSKRFYLPDKKTIKAIQDPFSRSSSSIVVVNPYLPKISLMVKTGWGFSLGYFVLYLKVAM